MCFNLFTYKFFFNNGLCLFIRSRQIRNRIHVPIIGSSQGLTILFHKHMNKEHKKNLYGKALEHQCFVWAEFVSVVDSIPPKPILNLIRQVRWRLEFLLQHLWHNFWNKTRPRSTWGVVPQSSNSWWISKMEGLGNNVEDFQMNQEKKLNYW